MAGLQWPSDMSPAIACAALSLCMVCVAYRPVWAWKLRKFPGPRRLPVIGNLLDILQHGTAAVWISEQAAKWPGDVFKYWQGGFPITLIKNADLARKILLSCTGRPSFEVFSVLVGVDREMSRRGVLTLDPTTHGNKFRLMRKAFESSVMNPAALAAHGTMLAECASRLVMHMARYASSGEPLNMTLPLSDMTMEAIGWAAFGLEFNCLGIAKSADGNKAVTPASGDEAAWYDAEPGSAEFSAGLVHSSRLIFKHGDLTQATPWKLPGMIMPALHPLTRRLANWFPDARLREELGARRGLYKGLTKMIAEWRRHKEAGGAANGAPLPAISEKGFLASMLNSVGSEVDIKEVDIMAQSLTMVLAGYETTAAALAVCMHLLATHPEAQSRAACELDEVLAGKAAMPGDVDKLPYLCGVFDEALRLYPPGDLAVRKMVTSDGRGYDIGDGRVIPDSTFVSTSIYTLQRDPAIWPRATEFLPERHMQPGNESLAPSNPNAFMPFGYGARMCVGWKFAQLEARLALARVLQAYTLKPAAGCPPPVWKSGIVYTPNAVWLTITPRVKST